MARDGILSVVIPVFNDEEVVGELHRRLVAAIGDAFASLEIIFVDDGSRDGSIKALTELEKRDERVVVIKLTRNFGQANAISAGLDHARGAVVVIMDSDLQDRPEDIPVLLEAMERTGCPMAIAQWVVQRESAYRRFLSWLFFVMSRSMTDLRYEQGLGVFRILRRSVVDAVIQAAERTGTCTTLMLWLGVPYVAVPLRRDPRFAGRSGYTMLRLLKLAAERLFSYSLAPSRFAGAVGAILAVLSLGLGAWLTLRRLLFGHIAAGWTSVVVLLLLLFGVNFLLIGILGEYIGRIYIEARRRPKYVVEWRNHSREKQ